MRPPLELHAEITTPDGLAQYRWDANAHTAEDRPQGISCSSKLMEGFSAASVTLARDINRVYPDIGPYSTLRLIGIDGTVAYEGYLTRAPRSNDSGHRVGVESVGWMMHAHDEGIQFLGVDQDISAWGQATSGRGDVLRADNFSSIGATQLSDNALSLTTEGAWDLTHRPRIEAWYDSRDEHIAFLYYAWKRGINIDFTDPSWEWVALVCNDRESPSIASTTGNLLATGPGAGTLTVTTPGLRYAFVYLSYALAGGLDGIQYNVDFTRLQVIGDHGIGLVGAGPYGLLGSDIIKAVFARAAPLIDTANVQATSYAIDQFAVKELATPYDIMLLANQYERWLAAVWEDRKLYYAPAPDLATADWVLRTDDPRVRTGYDGPSVDGQANGVKVQFQDITDGASKIVSPETNPELADTNTRLAANQAGRRAWQSVTLPNPNSIAGAVKIGAAVLAEYNRRRTPSRFVIKGHVQDGAGNDQQGWRPRAGDTVLVADDETSPVRLIHEAGWTDEGRTLTLNADAEASTIDAILDQTLNGDRRSV